MPARSEPAASAGFRIALEDPATPDVAALLHEHLADMRSNSPPESVHALDLEALRRPGISFWTVRENGELLGCGAMKQLDADTGEIKSMRTADRHRGRGVADRLLVHVIEAARQRGLRRLSLETGTPEVFAPARRLYARHGFVECAPFADYRLDPWSVYMTLPLQPEGSA